MHLICGELDAAVATVRRRLELLAPRAHDVEMAWEYSDTLHMAPMVYLAAGDLEAARRYAQQRSELPFFREADHLAVEWLLTTAASPATSTRRTRSRGASVEGGRRPAGPRSAASPSPRPRRPWCTASEATTKPALEWLEISAEMRRVVTPTAREAHHLQPCLRRHGGAAPR